MLSGANVGTKIGAEVGTRIGATIGSSSNHVFWVTLVAGQVCLQYQLLAKKLVSDLGHPAWQVKLVGNAVLTNAGSTPIW